MNTFLQATESQLVGRQMVFDISHGRVALDSPYPTTVLSDDERDELKTRLHECIPLDGMITDLWDYDVHFEELLEDDWYFAAVFGDPSGIDYCVELLAEFFMEKCNEYDMDYNQQGEEDEFRSRVLDQATQFVLGWRRSVVARYGSDVVSEQVDSPINERALRLGPGWDLDPSYLVGVSNYRDWDDVLGDLKNLVNKPFNLLKGWLDARGYRLGRK